MGPDGTLPTGHESPAPDPGGAGAPTGHGRFREAFNFAPDAQFVTDGHGVILEANHAASQLLRRAKDFLIGKPLALFSVEGMRQRFYTAIGRLAHGADTEMFESCLARRGEPPRDVFFIGWAGERDGTVPRPLHWHARDVTELKWSEAARAELQRRLTTSQEDERRRVARDLHDTVSQTLTALILGLSAVGDAAPLPEPALARLGHAQRLADELARQLHELATRLRPTALDDVGLVAAARQLVADWSARTGVAADFDSVGTGDGRFGPEVETTLYRVVQESLNNIAKHAGASHVAVLIARSDEHATAVIEDDGTGFDPESVPRTPTPDPTSGGRGRLGLLGMRERITLVSGTLEIESAPGRGTTVIARIPLSDAPP